MSEGLQWRSEGPHRPTFGWIHQDCGNRAAKIQMKHTYAYHCPECDVTQSYKMGYGFDRIEVET